MAERTGTTYRTVQETAIPRPLGGASPIDGVRLISGLDGVVSSIGAAAQEIKDASKELRILNQRHAQMLGSSVGQSSNATQAITQSMTDAINNQTQSLMQLLAPGSNAVGTASPVHATRVSPAAGTAQGTPPGTAPMSAPLPLSALNPLAQQAAGSSTGWQVSPVVSTPQSTAARVEAQPDSHAGGDQPNASGVERFHHNANFLRGDGGGFSLGNLRQTLGTRVQSQLGNRTWGPQLAQDASGDYRHLDENGLATGQKATSSEVSSFLRKTKVTDAVRGGAQTLAEGGTLRDAGLAMLPEGAAGALGVVGAGIFAAQKAGEFAASQRAQNAQWQSMMGGSQADALGQRAQSKMFQWGQFGVMNGSDAAALYQGVAATGMNQNQRNVAQDFAVNNYKDLGMSVQDSMDIINTASKTGQQSLDGVSKALDDMTKSAKDAGINTEAARQQFTQTWKAFSNVMGGANNGSTSIALSSGFTKAQISEGPQFQGVSINAADPNVMAILAARNGMTPGQLTAASMRKGGQALIGNLWQKTAPGYAQTMLGQSGMTILEQKLHGRQFKSLSQGEQQSLIADILQNVPSVTQQGAIDYLGGLGATGLTPANAIPELLGMAAGDFKPGDIAQKALGSGSTHKINTSSTGMTLGGPYQAGHMNYSKAYQSLMDDVHKNTDSGGGLWGHMPWVNSDAKGTANAFLDDVQKTGRAGGISQALAEDSHNGTDIAKMVRVQTPDGKKTVSLEDAMKHYRDQIDAGTAMITEGSKKNQTVADATGIVGDSHLKVTSSGKATGASASAAQHGQITVHAGPDLKKLLRFAGTGSVSIDPATGWSPPSAHVTANGRPSGTPGL